MRTAARAAFCYLLLWTLWIVAKDAMDPMNSLVLDLKVECYRVRRVELVNFYERRRYWLNLNQMPGRARIADLALSPLPRILGTRLRYSIKVLV
jgi:hypothetical protein